MSDRQLATELPLLRLRAETLGKIRSFFAERKVMEVETPLLADHTVSDPYIESLSVSEGGAPCGFLQTSPEYAMKRLLAAGSGAIYQLCKAFRSEEHGRINCQEFTMLEWYRPGWSHIQLIDETAELARLALGDLPAQRLAYREVFERFLGLDPWRAEDYELSALARDAGFNLEAEPCGEAIKEHRNQLIQFLFSHAVEPELGKEALCFIVDFPPRQAGLARIEQDSSGAHVARRFELFHRGVEIANGYQELTDLAEQQRRFARDAAIRIQQGKPAREPDPMLLAALRAGLPKCAGVALGVDRLLMLAAGAKSIHKLIACD